MFSFYYIIIIKPVDIKKRINLNYGMLTLMAIVSVAVFRFFYISILPLSADEAYFWVCSRHPALCFYDTPPMAPWMISISTALFGNTEFGVRVFVSVFMALASCILYLFSMEVFEGDRKSAFFSVLMLLSIPGFALAGLLSGVEAPLVLFYLLSVSFLYKAILKEKPFYWFLAGISTGLGFLTKYLILFLPVCLFLYLIFSDKRKYLKGPYPYMFLLTGILVSSPVIIWNAQNQWANFLLNFLNRTRTSPAFSVNFLNILKHIGAQAAIMSPVMLILLFYGFFKMVLAATSGKNKKMFFLFCFSAPVLIFFMLYSIFVEIPAPHWAGIGYIALITAVPRFIHGGNCGRQVKKLFDASIFTAILITSVVHSVPWTKNIFLKLPLDEKNKSNFESFLANFPSKAGKKLGKLRDAMPGKENYFLIGRGFATASYLEFYNPGQEEIYMLFQRTKLGHGYYFWQDINEKTGKNAIFVDENSRCEEKLETIFSHVEKLPDFQINNAEGKELKTFVFYNCIDFKGMEKQKPPVLRQREEIKKRKVEK